MKKLQTILILLTLILSATSTFAQKIPDSSTIKAGKYFVVIKNDGSQFVGKIISMDAHEVLIETKNIGQVSIPKHEVKEIHAVKDNEIDAKGEYKANEMFATRYFITTNGLPVEKGESYILWNWYGPDFQFGVAKNFGVGVMTSWLGMPVIASAKYSIDLGKDTHMALGTLLGTGSWALPKFAMALPFASFTYGNRRNNITFSSGYGAVTGYGVNGGRALFSVAGMARISKKASVVFDSFIMPGNTSGNTYTALYMPGIRVQTAPNKAFQFGFAGVATPGNFSPIPMLQWFRRL